MEDDLNLVASPFDLNAINACTPVLGFLRVVLDEVTNLRVFQEQAREFLLGGIPATLPPSHHASTEGNWINFLTHGRFSFP